MSKRIKVIRVRLANRGISVGVFRRHRGHGIAWGPRRSGRWGFWVCASSRRLLSLAFLGSSRWPLHEFTTGERIFLGFLVRDVGGRTTPRMTPTSLWRVGGNSRVVWGMGRGSATSKVHSRGVFEENLKFFDIRLIRSDLLE